MERSEKRKVLLEYFPQGHQFHYNVNLRNAPSEYYKPLGWLSLAEADIFTRMLHVFIDREKYDDPIVPFNKVKDSFDEFCRMIENNEITIKDGYATE